MELSRYELKQLFGLGSIANYRSAESFAVLYERTHLIVFRYIYSMHGETQQDVEDLWSETYLRAWRSRFRFAGDGDAALGWLLRIARNLVIDKHRRQKRYAVSQLQNLEDIVESAAEMPENRLVAKEEHLALWKMLETLSQEQREILILRYIVGWQVKQIAEHLQVPANSVSVTLRRTLSRMARTQGESP